MTGIRKAGEALLGVITDVLDFSKLDGGKEALDPTDFEPANIVVETCAILRTAASAKGLRLSMSVDPMCQTLRAQTLAASGKC